MGGVGIVGTGISGLILALRLQRLGVDATIYSESGVDELGGGRLPNTVGFFERTVARGRELGAKHFTGDGCEMQRIDFSITGAPAMRFTGHTTRPFRAVDFRALLPALLTDFLTRGGRLEHTRAAPTAAEMETWSDRHELMVVATGRESVAELFPRDPARSPYDRPQRRLCAALCTGITPVEPSGFNFSVSPGVGEIYQMPMEGRYGVVAGLLIEAIPGGPLTPLTERGTADDLPAYNATLLRLLREHAPPVARRIDPGAFGILGPDDILQGAVIPTVRHPVAEFGNGRIALAVGDAWITNDPITGQGANLGSHCAWIVAEEIAKGGPYDAAFGRRVSEELWTYARYVTEWTNAFLQPPPDYLLALLAAASAEQRLADTFSDFFSDPVHAWTILSDPARVQALIGGTG
ncbi:styrene monooxygenase/indole monooxygenase family protein [Rhizohabitans arisaemae]|uniref:styrene monooxygenase/indole monooxygenase family protein n=1 Tax=Rhizohabitans arisaemae TaxID=2720610 RepID=UPI0024B1DF0D|nr:styrene monooxygenase/indole monooxygenase family protein [Rhizohabitans arisaemae]